MIVREVIDNLKIIETFNYFNDYKDTRLWIDRMIRSGYVEYRPILKNLEDGFSDWVNKGFST